MTRPDSDPRWSRYWRFLTARFRRDVEDELAFHVEMRSRDLRAAGLPPEDARREAERRFGDRRAVQSALERVERTRGRRLGLAFGIEEAVQDLRLVLRGLVRRPVFAAVAAASLALGVATTTVAASLIDTWLLRSLPVERPGELVIIGSGTGLGGIPNPALPMPVVRALQERTDLFTGVGAFRLGLAGLRPDRAPQAELRLIRLVSGTWFPLLGGGQGLGRVLLPEDEAARARVVVLDHDYWTERFGGDPAVLGSAIHVNGTPWTVVGITAPDFNGTESLIRVSAYFPVSAEPALSALSEGLLDGWDQAAYTAVARRQPGQTLEEIRSALEVAARSLRTEHPELGEEFTFRAYPEHRVRVTFAAAEVMPLIAGAFLALGALVLVTGSVNVTNLVLTRVTGRRTEIAVRQALGASRGRVIRQLLTETVMIGLAGLALAWGLAWLAVRAFSNLHLGFDLPVAPRLVLDWRVFLVACAAALGAGALAGLLPALTGTRTGALAVVRGTGRTSSAGAGTQRLRNLLVGAQVAVSVLVVGAASVLVLSTRRAVRADLGFDGRHVLTVGLNPDLLAAGHGDFRRMTDRILQETAALPEVESAAWASSLPLYRSSSTTSVYLPDGGPGTDREGTIQVSHVAATPELLRTLRIRLLAGRAFSITDDSLRPRVALVNERLAGILWPGADPIGRQFRFRSDQPPVEVVGLIPTMRWAFIGETPPPMVIVPMAQTPIGEVFLAARIRSEPEAAAGSIRRVIGAVDRNLVPAGFLTLEDIVRNGPNGLLVLRLGAGLALTLGGMALFLTIVGLYGVVTVGVEQRVREFGVRLALGATPSRLGADVLRHAVVLGALGAAVGAPVAFVAMRGLRQLLFGRGPAEIVVVGVVAAVLIVTAAATAVLPARRAARLEIVEALRR